MNMSSKKINILYSSQSGDMIGGGQKSLLLLLERLDRNRINPFLVCPSDGDLMQRAKALDIETAVIPAPVLKKISLPTIIKCIRFIIGKRIDLIHTDTRRQTFYFGLAAKLTRKPLVWHIRVASHENRLYDRCLYHLADRIIAVSKAVALRFKGIGNSSRKVCVIYNGVDVREFDVKNERLKMRQHFGIREDEVFVGTGGQLVPLKGYSLFLEAAYITSRTFPGKFKYIIVGKGTDEYMETLKREAHNLQLEEKIIFTGFRNDIPKIMSAMDVFVLATFYEEGLSRVILEAMAAGIPVIASAIGGNPEVVMHGENGMLVQTGNAELLAKAILNISSDAEMLKQMGKKARKHVASKFSIEENVNKIQNVYEEILCLDT